LLCMPSLIAASLLAAAVAATAAAAPVKLAYGLEPALYAHLWRVLTSEQHVGWSAGLDAARKQDMNDIRRGFGKAAENRAEWRELGSTV
jgi:hypothetical protein